MSKSHTAVLGAGGWYFSGLIYEGGLNPEFPDTDEIGTAEDRILVSSIDENTIKVGGGSSGGHLAASLAMIPNENNKTYENIKAVIFFNPSFDSFVMVCTSFND